MYFGIFKSSSYGQGLSHSPLQTPLLKKKKKKKKNRWTGIKPGGEKTRIHFSSLKCDVKRRYGKSIFRFSTKSFNRRKAERRTQ